MTRPPPRDEHELRTRAMLLAGRAIDDLARQLDFRVDGGATHTKGKLGTLVEHALGATGGSTATHDFPELRIELKTIPLAESGAPRESTYVCTVPIDEAETVTWQSSWARSKLAHVLWIPIVTRGGERRVGTPIFWRPTRAQDDLLRADFDDIIGMIAAHGADAVTARRGKYMQMRPKAANGSVRKIAWGAGDERVATLPRGFYLRPTFTGAILKDPAALP